jgi:hypothetical protein
MLGDIKCNHLSSKADLNYQNNLKFLEVSNCVFLQRQ